MPSYELDLRRGDSTPVPLMAQPADGGWETSLLQANSIDEFVGAIDSHTLAVEWNVHYKP